MMSILSSRFWFCFDPRNDVSISIRFGEGDLVRFVSCPTSNIDVVGSGLKIGLTGRDRGSVLYLTGVELTTSWTGTGWGEPLAISMLGSRFGFCFDPTKDVSKSAGLGEEDLTVS